MKRVICIAILMVLAASTPSFAETTEYKLSGYLDFDFFWGRNLTSFDNDAADTPAFVESETELDLNISMTENVSALVSIAAWAQKPTDQRDLNINIDRMCIEIKEMFWAPLTVKIGMQNAIYQLCGDGCLRCGRSFTTRMEGLMGTNFILDFDKARLEFFWGKYIDNTGAAAPVLTGNTSDADTYNIFFQYNFSGENKIQAQVNYLRDRANMITNLYGISPATGNSDTVIFMGVLGIDWHWGDNWNVNAEIAYTGGRLMAIAGQSDIDVAGFAGHAGLIYTWSQVDVKPFLECEIVYYQGNDADRNGNLVDAGFVPWMGEYRRSLIIERRTNMVNAARETEGWYDVIGMNNYWIAHLIGGLDSIWDGKIRLEGSLHYAQATDETLDNLRGNKIGWEFDVIARYNYTEDLTFSLGLGYFVPHDDFAENRAAQKGATVFNNIDSDAAWIAVLNVTLTW